MAKKKKQLGLTNVSKGTLRTIYRNTFRDRADRPSFKQWCRSNAGKLRRQFDDQERPGFTLPAAQLLGVS